MPSQNVLITVVYEPDREPTEAGGKSGENASDSSQSIGIRSSSGLNSRIAFQVGFCWHGHYKFCPMSYIDKRSLGCPDPAAFHYSHVYHHASWLRRAQCSAGQPFTCGICTEFFLFNSHRALK